MGILRRTRKVIACGTLMSLLAVAPLGTSGALDSLPCQATHYCGICRCWVLFRGTPPTEIPVIRGTAPKNCVCPYSHNIGEKNKCSEEQLREKEESLQSNLPPIDQAIYSTPSKASTVPVDASLLPASDSEPENSSGLDASSIPREITFGPQPPSHQQPPPIAAPQPVPRNPPSVPLARPLPLL